jgi:hypothetical protein
MTQLLISLFLTSLGDKYSLHRLFQKARKSLLDIWPEVPHPNLLVSSAICPANDLIMWWQKQRLNFDTVTILADCQIAYYLNMFA